MQFRFSGLQTQQLEKSSTQQLMNHSVSSSNGFSSRAVERAVLQDPLVMTSFVQFAFVKMLQYSSQEAIQGAECKMTNRCPWVGFRDITISSGCSSIIFKIRHDKKTCKGVSALKERRKEEILIYGLLQLCSLIHHAVCVHAAITPLQGACLPHHAVGHSSSCLGNKLCALLRPPASPSKLFSSLLCQSHSHTQRHTMTGLLTLHETLRHVKIREVLPNTFGHD